MLTQTLMQAVADHRDQIVAETLRAFRREPDLASLRHLPEVELREWLHDILQTVEEHAAPAGGEDLFRRFERIGRARFEEDVPLHEIIWAHHLLKFKLLSFVRDRAVPRTSLSLHLTEELEYRVTSLFDRLLYHTARGYEAAQATAWKAGVPHR